MIVKEMKGMEILDAMISRTVAFEGPMDVEKEREKLRSATPDPSCQTWGAYSDDEKELYSSLVLSDYTVHFDGHEEKLSGVGGVATFPAHRRKGGVRACFQASAKALYERGYLFSALYPFSSAYYRQFGYEDGAFLHTWEADLAFLKTPSQGGAIEQLFPGDDLSPLLEIYNNFYGKVNLAARRQAFDRDLEKNLLEEKRYIFLWRDDSGAPRSFLIASRDGNVLDCVTNFSPRNAFLCSDAKSFRALLHFVSTAYIANYRAIRFHLPAFINPISLLPESSGGHLKCTRFPSAMTRILNVEKALFLCACKGQGAVKIKITSDPLLEENLGGWKLSFAPGEENRVERTREEPDVALSIGDFTALLCGYRSIEELSWMPQATLLHPDAPLSSVFYRKPCHLMELF